MILLWGVLGFVGLICLALWWAAITTEPPSRTKHSKIEESSNNGSSDIPQVQFSPQGPKFFQPILPKLEDQTPEEGFRQVNHKVENLIGRLKRLEDEMSRYVVTDTVLVPETLVTPESPKSPTRKGVACTPKKGTPATQDKGKNPQSASKRPDPSTPSKFSNKKVV